MPLEVVGPFERHVLPAGDVVLYRDDTHLYARDARQNKDGSWSAVGRYTGVSTVVGPIDFRPDGLLVWASRLTCDGVAVLASEGLSLEYPEDMRAALRWLTSGPAVMEALEDGRLTWRHLRDDRAIQGTNVHKHSLHALATGSPVPDFGAMTEQEKAYARGVMAFWHEHEPEPELSEQVVAIPEHGVAGRLDLVYRDGSDPLDIRRLLDCKTTACVPEKRERPFYPPKDQAQVAGYALGLTASGFGATDLQEVLYVDEEGRYELVPSAATHGTFLDCLRVYRESARIKSESKKSQKRERVAA